MRGEDRSNGQLFSYIEIESRVHAKPPLRLILIFSAPLAALLSSGCADGKGAAGEVALDLATGRDCWMMEGFFRNDRETCEQRGPTVTNEDFKGVFAFLAGKPPQKISTDAAMLAEAPAASPHRVKTLKRIRPETENV